MLHICDIWNRWDVGSVRNGNTSLPFKKLVTTLNFCAFNFLYPNHSAVLTVLTYVASLLHNR